jgi:hypothetical protein
MTKPYAEIYDILRRLRARSDANPAQGSHREEALRQQAAGADGREHCR